MPEKRRKMKLRKDLLSNQDDIETTSSIADDNRCLLEPDFGDISS